VEVKAEPKKCKRRFAPSQRAGHGNEPPQRVNPRPIGARISAVAAGEIAAEWRRKAAVTSKAHRQR
jgi:hypothetical protein